MRKKQQTKQGTSPLQLGLIYPGAAGIDVGSMSMMVSYPDKKAIQTVAEYNAYTDDLEAMAEQLKQAGVTHVCLEATGVYWMAVYEILENKGFIVTMVNARHYKNVAGQKTDVKDCQWLQQLHAHGLLRASHIAEEQYRELRTYIHERNMLQKSKSNTLNRIHKVLTQMNIKVQHLISDIEGIAGMAMINHIANGATSAEAILSGVNIQMLKAGREDIEKSLKGIFKPHFIKVLKHHLTAYHFYREQMLEYEKEVEALLIKMLPQGQEAVKPKKQKARKNQYHFNLKEYLHRMAGIDLTEIDGLDENTVLTIISVVGLNMHKWPTANHFVSWLNLAARPMITGGKVTGYQKRFTTNAATQAFRMAAQTMWQHKGALGQLYRRLASTKGSPKAIKAVARRLAIIFYSMLKNQTNYDAKIVALDADKIRERKIARLRKEAQKLGCTIEIAAA